ncbi:unnamed protein product, partial [Prorocentrum cordatum]
MAGGHQHQQLWTRCTQCQTCEWNGVLARRHNICNGCGNEVKPFEKKRRPRRVQFVDEFGDSDADGFYDATSGSESERPQPRRPGILKGPVGSGLGGGKGGKGGKSVKSLLEQALAAATDPTLKADLQAQLDKLAKEESGRE